MTPGRRFQAPFQHLRTVFVASRARHQQGADQHAPDFLQHPSGYGDIAAVQGDRAHILKGKFVIVAIDVVRLEQRLHSVRLAGQETALGQVRSARRGKTACRSSPTPVLLK